MAYNGYYSHHDYPPQSATYAGSARDRYASNASSTGHGTAVPPSAGPSPPPPRVPPVPRPHTTQPQPGYPYGPPPIPQGYPPHRGGGGIYGGPYGYPPYGGGGGGYGAPPMSYADSLLAQPPMPGAGAGGGGAGGNPKSPRIDEKDGRKPDPDTLNPKSPASSSPPPLTNAAAVAQAEAAAPGISERLPDFKDWPAEDRDRVIRELVERMAPPNYPPAGYGHPPPQHYPAHPYYPFYPPPHAGYNPHMPPPHHAEYGYLPPLQPPQLPQQQQNTEPDDHSGEEAEEKERIDRERERERASAANGGAPIMPGGYASSPSRETPPPLPPQPQSNKPSRPASPHKTPPNPKSPPPAQAHNKKADLQDAHNRDRPGSMPPPKTRPVKTPAPEDMGKHMSNSMHMFGRTGSRREQQQQQAKVGAGATDPTLLAQLGPSSQGDMTTIGVMWGVYLLEHKGQKKGTLPGLRPKLRGLLGGIAAWIIKDIEPKDSLVIPPDKLIKFYQMSQVDDEPFKWEAFIHALPQHNLSELYQQLECHHHLIPPPPRSSSTAATNANPTTPTTPNTSTQDSTYAPFDPTIPALTPQGFAQWMLIQLTAFPTREHLRLQKIIREFPIQDPETGSRFPKSLPRDTIPTHGDGLVENWWDEAVMSVRKGGYISMGFDDDAIGGDDDFGYGPNSELVRGRERRPYAKSNVSSRAASRSQSRGDRDRGGSRPRAAEDDNFAPPALLRKKTDQKYASTNITFDDLRGDTTKSADLERKRKPYGGPPTKASREAVYPTGGGGGTPINPRPGGGGMGMPMGMGVGGERPGSHGSGSGGSGGRLGPNNGGGVDLPSTPNNVPTGGLHSTTSPTPTGGIKIKPPNEYKTHPHHPYPQYRYPNNSSTPTTPASAHPTNSTANNTPSTLFSSPQSQSRNTFTPISPLSGGGAYPELHHYSPGPAPHRGYSRRDRERGDTSPPISMAMSHDVPPSASTARMHNRRRSMGAADAADYFGGELPSRAGYEPERTDYPGHGARAQGYQYSGRKERERSDTLPSAPWDRQEEDDEGYYQSGGNPHGHGGGHGGHGGQAYRYGYVRREERDEHDEGSMGMGGGGARPPGVRRRKSKGPGEFEY